jgi:hypothetical protein
MPNAQPDERKVILIERATAAVVIGVFLVVLYMVFIYRP